MKKRIIIWRKFLFRSNLKSVFGALYLTLLTLFLLSFDSPQSDNNSLLWKIEGNGIKKPSYLFGSMHLIEKQYFYFPTSLEKIFKKSAVLVMELDELPNQSAAMKYLMLEDGTLFDLFDSLQVDSLILWANQTLNIEEKSFRQMFAPFKPLVIIQAATQMQFKGETASYEMKFSELAKKYNITTKGLESIEEQISFFEQLSTEQQVKMTMEAIREDEKSADLLKQMQQIYQRQQIDSLFMLIQSDEGILAQEQSIFIDQRNQNWITKMKSDLTNGAAFFVVGAGHLPGKNGLIQLLKNEGYTLTPLRF